MPSSRHRRRSTRSPPRRPPRSPTSRSSRSPRNRRSRARTQPAADPRQPRASGTISRTPPRPQATAGSVGNPPHGTRRVTGPPTIEMSPPPRDPRQGQRASAEPVANPVTPPRRCPGSPRPSEVVIHRDTLITPPRPPSALGLDLSPETMAMLARFTEFDAVALDSLREEALHIAMDTEQEVPAHSGRFSSLVHRTVSPLRRQCETTTPMPTADEPVVISDDEENIPLPGMDVDTPIVTPADDPPPPYGSWEEEAPPTYEEACGLLSRRVVGSEETEGTAPVSLLGRRRRDPVAPNLSDVSEDETAPRLPVRPWLNPDLDMGPSTSAEAQRRREAAAIEPTTTTGHEGITTGSSMDIEPETAAWVRAPPKWTVHTPERLLPPILVARLEGRVAQGRGRNVRFQETCDGRCFRIRINTKEHVTVSIRPPGERGGCDAP
ncbi:hypothetical protein ACLKA7_007743 [Drosophila subpalustris]